MIEKSDIFNERMMETVNPGSSAKELLEKIVKSALEVEFGAEFTLNSGFAKMVSKIADSLITNPELRRQALTVAGTYINRKMELKKTKIAAVTPPKEEIKTKGPVPVNRRYLGPNLPINL